MKVEFEIVDAALFNELKQEVQEMKALLTRFLGNSVTKIQAMQMLGIKRKRLERLIREEKVKMENGKISTQSIYETMQQKSQQPKRQRI